MIVCLKIENEAVDVIIILCFKWNLKNSLVMFLRFFKIFVRF